MVKYESPIIELKHLNLRPYTGSNRGLPSASYVSQDFRGCIVGFAIDDDEISEYFCGQLISQQRVSGFPSLSRTTKPGLTASTSSATSPNCDELPAPTAVLYRPVLFSCSDFQPTAVLYVPVVRLKRACSPSAVLPPGIISVGRRTKRLNFWQKPKANE
jgi:hypothetical protein